MRYTSRFRSLILWITLVPFVAIGQAKLADLPLREFQGPDANKALVLYLTGDGGWNNFSQQLVEELTTHSYSVVVLDSRKYFWNSKTPDQFTSDVQGVLDYYLKKWKLTQVMVVGYSFGADVSAFLPSKLSGTMVSRLKPMVLISPSYSTDFEIRLSDLIGSSSRTKGKYNVEEAIMASRIVVWCLFGEDEDLLLREKLKASDRVKIKVLPGSHHYNNKVDVIANFIEAIP